MQVEMFKHEFNKMFKGYTDEKSYNKASNFRTFHFKTMCVDQKGKSVFKIIFYSSLY